MNILLSDMGGTNIRFAVADSHGIGEIIRFKCADFPCFEDALAAFLYAQKKKCQRFVLAVPGPVTGDELAFVNNPWRLHISDIQRKFAFESMDVINDFMAQALAIPHLDEKQLVQLGKGSSRQDAVSLIVGPGTGLGVGICVPSTDNTYRALPSEGGHIALAAADEDEERILKQVFNRFGRVSAERVICGLGLSFLYECLNDERLSSEQIMDRAYHHDAAALKAVLQMFAFLGDFCGDLALTLCAEGGVYLSGGVLQSSQAVALLRASDFRARFEAKSRHSGYVKKIPTFVVMQKDVAFVGLQTIAKNYFVKK